ncbi:hypothetical protein D3C87_1593710 [compost metagenome]
MIDIVPKLTLNTLDLCIFRIFIDFLLDHGYFLQFQVDDIIHHALCSMDVLFEQIPVKFRFRGEWVVYIGVQIDRQETARIICT